MRRREPAQAMGLAAVSIVSIVAIMAFVIDASTFFVIRRELQNAADAGALAGAMYLAPDASTTLPVVGTPDCSLIGDHAIPPAIDNHIAVQVACHYAQMNFGQASRLCNTPAHLKDAYTRVLPPYNIVVLEVACDAQFSFGRIINLRDREVSAYAVGASGTWDYSLTPPQFRPHIDVSVCTDLLTGVAWCKNASRLIPSPL